MSMEVIPATNKSFAANQEHGEASVQDDKVKTWVMPKTAGAGVLAILGQHGVKVPTR